MYILNNARYNKKTRRIIPNKMPDPKLWVCPATLYNTFKGASDALERAVKNAVDWAKGDKLNPVVHTDPSDPYYKVVETEKYLEIFRITDDEPED